MMLLFLEIIYSEEIVPEGLLYETVNRRSITITKYIGYDTSVNIPASIGGLPVTVIGRYAFSGCSELTSITIPSSVVNIENSAFSNCVKLKNIIIPSSVVSIGDSAFFGCEIMTNIDIPSSVTSIGRSAFIFCENLITINVDRRNTAYMSFGGVLFDKSGKTLICYPASKGGSYTIPSSVTAIGDTAFLGCKDLLSVDFPYSLVTSIGVNAFAACKNLTNVTLPDFLQIIAYGAFSGCDSFTSVTIPSLVTSIGDAAFRNCEKLTSINIEPRNTAFKSIDGVLFDKSGKKLICYPSGKIGEYTIPSSVTSIGNYAFSNCNNLTSVTIPSSVTTIGNDVFSWCKSLTSITIPSSVTVIGTGSFQCCFSLTRIIIPSSVTTIYEGTFLGCDKLTSATLSRKTNVEDGAFPEGVKIQYRD